MTNKKNNSINSKIHLNKVVYLLVIISIITSPWVSIGKAAPVVSPVVRRVNIPYLGSQPPASNFVPAIFWFGKVEPTINYTDVRTYYYDNYITFVIHIFDRRLWYKTNPTIADLPNWDAVTVYLKLNGNTGAAPDSNTFRMDAQLSYGETDRSKWQAAYRGTGSTWASTNISFTTVSGYRFESGTEGGLNIDQNDRGWTMDIKIPFTSLGLSGKPAAGTTWGLGMVVHDRDDQIGTPIPDQIWPETLQPNVPSSWGQMNFQMPIYSTPSTNPVGSTTIRNGLNGAAVKDGEVGGHTTCSEALWPDIWNTFGHANYAGYDQINIQNEWDLSDWSCFSKYYITFPLASVPAGKTIISASLSMYLFGGSWGGDIPPDTYIQAMTVNEDWNEATLNWNNAPMAVENFTGTWVEPIQSANWIQYKWDVSRAVAQAIAGGQPLRLVFYSADGEYHTGKYFISSKGQDVGRPTLKIEYGQSCGSQELPCHNSYIALVRN